ncbi:MAG: hypothetical protein WA624_20920 [Methylocella sp.]
MARARIERLLDRLELVLKLIEEVEATRDPVPLSILTSLFPFLIFVTALAGFFGSTSLADEVHQGLPAVVAVAD